MSNAASPEKNRRAPCPVCGKPAPGGFGPFCGQGCRDRDLLNWLGDSYRVPGPPVDEGALGGAGEGALDGEGGLDR